MKKAKKGIAILLVMLMLSAFAAVFAAALPGEEGGTAILDPAPARELTSQETPEPVNGEGSPKTDATPEGSTDTQDNGEQSAGTSEEVSDEPALPGRPDAKVSLTASSVEVIVRRSIQMTAETEGFNADPELIWTSSDESVAKVEQNGKVTGVKIGRATITATATYEDRTASDSMEIYVIAEKTPMKLLLQQHQLLGYKYNFVDNYYYINDVKCWQSGFGFGRFYDLVAPYLLLEYDYVRVFFTYEGKDYMVQLWKGQYGMLFYGCEQGIYYKEHSDKQDGIFTFYKGMDQSEWPQMSMSLYHDTLGNGNYEREFTRETGTHWWCSGFKPGHLRIEEPATELRQVGTITFRQEEMARLFAEGLKTCGFGEASDPANVGLDEFHLDGATVSFCWQNISDAETTMPIKIAGGAAIGAGALAFFFGMMILLAIILMSMGGLLLLFIVL